jgi:hypothetical protein
MTDDSELDLIPEKESPEMLWSPEEIEMKKFESTFSYTVYLNKESLHYESCIVNNTEKNLCTII